MQRLLTALFLVLCLCWQGLACAGADVLLADEHHLAHAALHFEGAAHHHDNHQDGGIHLDNSPASVHHLMEESCAFALGITSVVPLWLPTLKLDMPVASIASAAPPPFIDGLERPPRLAS
jgi:hypothetical protein